MFIHKNCRFDPNTRLGAREPIVIFQQSIRGDVIPFHITKSDYVKLNGGCGVCYGRTPWGKYHRLKIYDYRVIFAVVVNDPNELQKIFEDRNT